jgi:hypothetical protein
MTTTLQRVAANVAALIAKRVGPEALAAILSIVVIVLSATLLIMALRG